MFKTEYASAKRANHNDLINQSLLFNNSELKIAFDSVNILVVALNKYRQIVYANKAMLDYLELQDPKKIIGKRFGEAVNCQNSSKCEGGCGTSASCRTCGITNTLLKSMNYGQQEVGEGNVLIYHEDKIIPINVEEKVTPYYINGNEYYIASYQDISDTLRRKNLEKVFFHDVLNTAGSLKGLLGMLQSEVPQENKGDVEFLTQGLDWLQEELISQRHLLEAEDGTLSTDMITLHSTDVIESVAKLYAVRAESEGKVLIVDDSSIDAVFKSDYVLLKRVISNMVKNAIEASKRRQRITVGCELIEDKKLRFYVKNETYIPTDVQTQLFKRSFSTKGSGRGIGTYSMKLFGETYLKGKVGFISSEEKGTSFFVDLILN